MTDHRKLDRLLDLRRHEEQRRAVELALARRASADAQAALDQLGAQRGQVERSIADICASVRSLSRANRNAPMPYIRPKLTDLAKLRCS